MSDKYIPHDKNFNDCKKKKERNRLYKNLRLEIKNNTYPNLESEDIIFVLNMLRHKIEEGKL